MHQSDGLLVSGTDTGVGKTRVSCWLIRALRAAGVKVGGCKPVASGSSIVEGAEYWEDPARIAAALAGEYTDADVTPIRFRDPLSPPMAARRENKSLVLEDYQKSIRAWEQACDYLVVEGVGGLLCPITDRETVADLATWWGRPVLIVARAGLGTINHTLLTRAVAEQRGLHVVGVVLNRAEDGPVTLAETTNPAELRRLIDVPVWGPIAYAPTDETIPEAVLEIRDFLLSRRAVAT